MKAILRVVVAALLFAVVLTPQAETIAGAAVPGDEVRSVATAPDIRPVDVVWDPVSGLAFAVTQGHGTSADSLVSFDPADGSVAWTLPIGTGLTGVAIADDGSTVYVARPGVIDEVDVGSEALVATHDLGDEPCGDRVASDMLVESGDPSTVIVALASGCSSDFVGVARITNGVIAPSMASPAASASRLIEVDATTMLGLDETDPCRCLRRFTIAPGGVTHSATLGSAVYGSSATHHLGEVIGNDGRIYDAVTGAFLRQLEHAGGTVAPIAVDDIVYFTDSYDVGSFRAYDLATGYSLGDPVWLASFGDDLLGALLTTSGVLAWEEFGFLEEADPPGTPKPTIEISAGVDVSGTGYSIRYPEPVRACLEFWDAATEQLIAVVETVDESQHTLVVPHNRPIRIFVWDCFGFGFFPEWYADQVLVDYDDATDVIVQLEASERVSIHLDPFFFDVDREAYYFEPVWFLRNAGITKGCSKIFYCPADFVTREQMAAFVARFWRLFDGACSGEPSPFGDVPASSFAYYDVGCIADLGVTQGTGPGTYSPANFVTREQMAAFIARLWRAFGHDCPDGDHPFTDVPESSFASDDVACIYLLGITTGTTPTTYSPGNLVTRAQMAAFLERLYDAILDAG